MMPITLNWKQIEPLIRKTDISDAMREAFIEYSKGNAVIPPVGELIMDQPRGEVHIKYGYIKGCLLYTSPSPRDRQKSRMPSSA